MNLFISYFYIFSITLFFVITFNKKFEKCVFLSFILPIVLMYTSGYLGSVKVGFYISMLFVLLAYVMLYVKRKYFKAVLKNYFTLGFVFYTFIFIYIYILYRYEGFNYWDEFMHWEQMVKELLRLDQFYCVSESVLMKHKDYPPFFALLETLWCYLARNYNEGLCYRALISFVFALLVQVFDKFEIKEKKDWIKSLAVFVSIIAVRLCLQNTNTQSDSAKLFNSIYVDWTMAIFSGIALFSVFSSKNIFDKYNLVVNCIYLTMFFMMKQIGIAFYLLVLASFIVNIIVNKEINRKNLILLLILYIFIPFAIKYSWSIYISNYIVDNQFNISQINLSTFVDIFKGCGGEAYQIESCKNFIDAIFNRPLVVSPIKLTYFVISLIITVVFIMLNRHVDGILTGVIYLGGSIVYAGVMLLLYMYSFDSIEGPMLASFDRYMTTYVFFGFVFLIATFIDKYASENNFKILAVLTILIFVDVSNINSLIPNKDYDGYLSTEEFKKDMQAVEPYINSRVLEVKQYNAGFPAAVNYYYMEKMNCFERITIGGDVLGVEISFSEWIEKVREYDFIYLHSVDDYFIKNYWEPMTNTDLFNGGIYKIDIVNGEIQLTLDNYPF